MDVDAEIVEAEDREESLQQLEAALLERLDREGYAVLWKKFKTGLHCERFFESPTGRMLSERLIRSVIDAQNEWLEVEPDSKEAAAAHRRALAAKMALFSIDEILQDGHEAEVDLRRIEQEVGTP